MGIIKNFATLDTTAFNSGLGKMQGGVKGVGKSLMALPGLGGLIAGAGLIAGIKEVGKMADELDNLSKQTDLNVESIQALKFIAEEGGIAFKTLRPAINMYRRSVDQALAGNENIIKSFTALGISMYDLERMNTDERFDAIAKALYNAQGDANDMANITKLLGAESTRLNDILKTVGKDGLPALIAGLKESGLVMDAKTIKSLDRTEEAASRLWTRLKVLGVQTAGTFSMGMEEIATYTGALAAGASNAEALQQVLELIEGQANDTGNALSQMAEEFEDQSLGSNFFKFGQRLADRSAEERRSGQTDAEIESEALAELQQLKGIDLNDENKSYEQRNFILDEIIKKEKLLAEVRKRIESTRIDREDQLDEDWNNFKDKRDNLADATEKLRLSRLTDEALQAELKSKLAVAEVDLHLARTMEQKLRATEEILRLEGQIIDVKNEGQGLESDLQVSSFRAIGGADGGLQGVPARKSVIEIQQDKMAAFLKKISEGTTDQTNILNQILNDTSGAKL